MKKTPLCGAFLDSGGGSRLDSHVTVPAGLEPKPAMPAAAMRRACEQVDPWPHHSTAYSAPNTIVPLSRSCSHGPRS
jgi:hypothetical protein